MQSVVSPSRSAFFILWNHQKMSLSLERPGSEKKTKLMVSKGSYSARTFTSFLTTAKWVFSNDKKCTDISKHPICALPLAGSLNSNQTMKSEPSDLFDSSSPRQAIFHVRLFHNGAHSTGCQPHGFSLFDMNELLFQ